MKPSELGPRIRDVEAFWYKTEIKIIFFVPLCLILWFTLTLNCSKLKNCPIFFRGYRLFFWSYIIPQGICNKFIEMKIYTGTQRFSCDCVCFNIENLSNIDEIASLHFAKYFIPAVINSLIKRKLHFIWIWSLDNVLVPMWKSHHNVIFRYMLVGSHSKRA